MKRITILLIIYSAILLMNSGCHKEDNGKPGLHFGCFTEVFSVPSWYSDSIFYADNKISRINKNFKTDNTKNTQARFEYGNNEVKIFVRDFFEGSWRDFIYYILSYSDSRISQIETNSNRVRANYFYDNNNLKYVIYYKNGIISDSISVAYDTNGNNITHALWFKFDQSNNKYQLANSVAYYYDDKINPYKNSLHFLYNFYDDEEYSLDYFNTNNFITIKSTKVDIHTDYNYNVYNYPVYIVFYDQTNEETDRNALSYDCK
jgi:hypothetical protein